MIERRDEPPPRPATRLAQALRNAFLQDVGLHGAPDGAQVVGRYLLLEPIGAGASGTVWRALHRELLHDVAVKVFKIENGDRPERVERFRREAATAARLHHPGIVAVHDFGSDGGAHYLAMELVEGRPFDRWLSEEKPDLGRRLAVVERVARAAQHAHEQGVVHRDLKPANVVVRALDAPVIVDFGVARALGDDHLTREGAVVGTVAFMAPEQLRGERDVDARADVWALGMLLHFAATGALPFPADESPVEALRIRLSAAPRPRQVDPSLPHGLDVLVRRCLEPEVALRLQSAGALADDLARLRRGEAILAGATTFARRLWRRVCHRPLRAALVACAVVALALVARELLRTSRELTVARGTLDETGRLLQVQEALLDLSPRLKPLFARAERARYAETPEVETAALLHEIDGVLDSSSDATGVRDAYRAWALFLLRSGQAAAAFDGAKARHPENPIVWLLAARCGLRRCADTPSWSPTQPVTYELLVEPLASPSTILASPAAKAVVASARDDLERARAVLFAGGVPGLNWARQLCDGFEHFAAGDAKGAIERLMPLAHNDEIDLEATLLLCFALVQEERAPEAIVEARRLREARPGVVPASKLLALCLQYAARDRLGRGGSPIRELEKALAVLAGVKRRSLVDEVVVAQIEFDLECARLFGGSSTAAAWAPIVQHWVDLREKILASDVDERARGAAHAHVGWARNNLALFDMPRAGALPELRKAAEDYRHAAELAPDSLWVGVQRVQSRALIQEVLARLGLPVEREQIDGALQDVVRLRELANARVPKSDWGLAEADVGEAQLVFCATLASDAAGATRADAFARAAALAHAADARDAQVGSALPIEIECELHALLAAGAPVARLRAAIARLVDPLLADNADFVARFVRPLVDAAFARERGERTEVATLAADLARRSVKLLPDHPGCTTLVVESELALRFVDADSAAAHVDAALAACDDYLARHATSAEATRARAFALAALSDLGGRDGLDEAACLEAIRAAITALDDGEARTLLLDLWLAQRDDDDTRAGEIAGQLRTKLAADPDAKVAVRNHLAVARAALELPGAPKEAVAAAQAWDEAGKAIDAQR